MAMATPRMTTAAISPAYQLGIHPSALQTVSSHSALGSSMVVVMTSPDGRVAVPAMRLALASAWNWWHRSSN